MRFAGIACALALIICLPLASDAQAKFNPRKAIWGPVMLGGHSAFPIYKELGVGIYSIALDWNYTAARKPRRATDPKDPAYRWPWYVSHAVKDAAKYGIRVNIEITYAPRWSNGGHVKQWAPDKASDFAQFAVAAARRYPSVHLWMVWGEPSRTHNFMPYDAVHGSTSRLTPGQARGPQKYAQLVDATYGALKQINSRNLIIGGSTFTGGDIRTVLWIRYMRLPSGKPPRMDLYSHNPFIVLPREPNLGRPPSPANNIDFSDLGRLDAMVTKDLAKPRGKKRIPLFISEWCVPTGPDGEFKQKIARSEAIQARWIRAAFKIVNRKKDPFIYAMGWIHLHDGDGSSAGLMTKKLRRKQGFYAFKNG
jgi:hypothetical protein